MTKETLKETLDPRHGRVKLLRERRVLWIYIFIGILLNTIIIAYTKEKNLLSSLTLFLSLVAATLMWGFFLGSLLAIFYYKGLTFLQRFLKISQWVMIITLVILALSNVSVSFINRKQQLERLQE